MKMHVPLLLRLYFLFILCCPAMSITASLSAILDKNTNNIVSSSGDGAALMSFKALITHDPYGSLSSWGGNYSNSLHFCQWEGVACRRHKGQFRVIALNLRALDLVGPLSPLLGNLTYLRRLHLPENWLFGPIPDELVMLSNLHHLNLSFNQPGGIIPDTLSQHCSAHLQTIVLKNNTIQGEIPANLSRCLGLQYIDFQNNFLSGIIPSSLGALRDLKYLFLGNNHLEANEEGANLAFLAALANCSNLQALDLSMNKLVGALPSSVGNLSVSLKFLGMDSNQISGSIPSGIVRLINLQELHLGANLLQGNIPQEIGNLQRLRILGMPDNQISGALPSSLQNISGLVEIHFHENSLSGGFFSIFENLTSLSVVDLGENNFTGHIPTFSGSQSSLRALYLVSNNLTGNIPPSLGNLRSLTTLDLSENDLTGIVPNSLWNHTSLENIGLGENNLAGVVPPNIGHTLPNLLTLLLYNNRFHGPIPTSLTNCSSLEEIVLLSNAFSGRIPRNLGILKNLHYLALEDNRLEAGRQPTDWAFLESLVNCTKLRSLTLGNNQLSGILPGSVANLSTTLRFLHLEANGLQGGIPEEIKNLVGLERVIMYQNHFMGVIPATIGSLGSLHILAFSHNELSGVIPSTIGNLTNLSELYLSFNNFSGRIPVSLGNCTQLELLNLHNNRLIGSIPREVLTISHLSQGLGLSSNSLTGALPSAIGSLKNLEGIEAAGNRLSGQIPDTIGQCTQLLYIDFSSNLFEGSIPLSLRELRGLEELDLSNNNMSGEIPKFLETFQFLKYLNLSFNHFQREVPTKGIFANTSLFTVIGNEELCGGIPELNLPPCRSIINVAMRKHHTSHTPAVAIIAASVVVCFIILLSIFGVWRYKPGKLFSSMKRITRLQNVKVSYTELLKATNRFSPENLIGSGSFGSVYKGNMEYYYGHEIVAIKVLNLQQFGASRSFEIECKVLRGIRHRNLLKVLTSCSGTDYEGNDFKALIFQFMPNGSLDEWLHPPSHDDRRNLSLVQRINIAIDVACALDYLHSYGPTPIIHCDLKPSNVLLDHDMVAHVGDFGLAKLVTESRATISTSTSTESIPLKGTIGYIPPEYGMANQVSIKGDVYSFGILLLEMFTGKRPTDNISTKDRDIHHFVQLALPERVTYILDPRLLSREEEVEDGNEIQHVNSISRHGLECIISVLKIGLLCSNELPTGRIEIERASKELHAVRNIFLKQELAS